MYNTSGGGGGNKYICVYVHNFFVFGKIIQTSVCFDVINYLVIYISFNICCRVFVAIYFSKGSYS